MTQTGKVSGKISEEGIQTSQWTLLPKFSFPTVARTCPRQNHKDILYYPRLEYINLKNAGSLANILPEDLTSHIGPDEPSKEPQNSVLENTFSPLLSML